MSNEGHPTSAPPTPAESAPAIWEDFIDIFYAPSQVYERRRGWSAWPVLLGLTVVLAALFFAWQRVLGPVLDLEMQRAMAEAMADNPDLAAEQVESMRAMSRIFGVLGFAIAFPLGVLITALVAWALARAFGGVAAFASVLMVVTYSQLVRVPQYVLGLFQGQLLDVGAMDSIHDVSLGLARFLDQPDSSDLVIGLAARVDLFTLWATALIAIGLRVATGLSRGGAWGVALIVWLLAALPTVIGGLMGG